MYLKNSDLLTGENRAYLKEEVRRFWNRASCDTEAADSPKFSREYFEEIESFRYVDQAFIHSFAQFTRYHGKKVLEVGFGAGTDFIQWVRAGAFASGVDLTQEALDNLEHRIKVYELPFPEKIQLADAERLPFPRFGQSGEIPRHCQRQGYLGRTPLESDGVEETLPKPETSLKQVSVLRGRLGAASG